MGGDPEEVLPDEFDVAEEKLIVRLPPLMADSPFYWILLKLFISSHSFIFLMLCFNFLSIYLQLSQYRCFFFCFDDAPR